MLLLAALALLTLPKHSSQSVRLEPPKASVENRMMCLATQGIAPILGH